MAEFRTVRPAGEWYFQQVKAADEEYPPVFCRTAAGDTRVHPVHARKFVARLQTEASGGPFLFRSTTDTGHGVGKSQSQLVAEQLDNWTFFRRALAGDGFSD
jgi:prolyl oligopeptidase